MNINVVIISFLSIFLAFSCVKSDPNKDTHIEEVIELQHEEIDYSKIRHYDTTYVPIYSNIYNRSRDQTLFLTSTLSIRNTSLVDSFYVTSIDYYNTKGDLLRSYLDKPIFLVPVESVDYVIDEQDKEGGSGANFVITWCAKTSYIYPVFQAINIGSNGQQGYAFSTDGYSISKRIPGNNAAHDTLDQTKSSSTTSEE